MDTEFKLSEYMNKGIENIVKGIVKASLRNPKETIFAVKYRQSSKEAQKKRAAMEQKGQKVPAFLIGSITSSCNLFCKGCYARANKLCGEREEDKHLSAARWAEIFREAQEIGVSFILLAGGEPLIRQEVIEKAAQVKDIIFPIFTNGTMLQEDYIALFDRHRNLVPILSIEGNAEQTDSRRGQGTYELLMDVMDKLNEKGILYGASVTVTTRNVRTVTSKSFFDTLYRKGCKAVIFVEFVPVTQDTNSLAPTDIERKLLENGQQQLREAYADAVFLSFPGDEKYSDGCLAAGRGFFHISADGAAEPCPFSPYSDTNLKNASLLEALSSPLFKKLEDTGMLLGEHEGGCLLFQKEQEVRDLLEN